MPRSKGQNDGPRRKHPTTCKECGTSFQSARNDATWCGPTCRQRSYRRRKAAQPLADQLQQSLARARQAAQQYLSIHDR